jgi:hypothetical protein
LYTKGLCHAELGDLEAATQILEQTQYYDLSLAEKLIAQDAAGEACRGFLARARDWYRGGGSRSKDAPAQLARIEALLRRL